MDSSDSTKLSPVAKDERGNVYGKLTVIAFAGVRRSVYWTCKCECGNTTTVSGANLRAGRTTSCGCNHTTIRGLSTTPEYQVWYGMKRRCYCKKNCDYKHYGGRGIKVCDRWKRSFISFFEDMGPRPFDGATIERIDNDGDYEPENCRWATQEEQKQNTRGVRRLTYNGETMGISAWARKLGIDRSTLRLRLDKGWDLCDVFTSESSFVPMKYRKPPLTG